jgi:hypothetical protein
MNGCTVKSKTGQEVKLISDPANGTVLVKWGDGPDEQQECARTAPPTPERTV